jgi:hypothetical protein
MNTRKRNLNLTGLMALCAILAVFASASQPALAAEEHPYLPSQSLIGVFSEAIQSSGLATDSHGDVYVSEYLGNKVTVYSPAGSVITEFAPTSPPKGFGPSSLAVDSSGDVYVQVYNRSVIKYKPSAFPPTAATTYEVDKTAGTEGVIVPNASEAHAVAIDPANQDLYVAEAKHIASYTSNGVLISAKIGEGIVSSPEYYGVDVYGANGDVYAIDKAHSAAYLLNPTGTEILAKTQFTSATAQNLFDLAVDQSDGNFYVTSSTPNEESTTSVVDEFSASGAYVSRLPHEFGASLHLQGIRGPSDIAVDNGASSPNGGDVFVASADPAHGKDSVYAFGPRAAAPTERKLVVAADGNGAGRLTCEVNGAFEECASEYAEGTQITLTGLAEAGSVFAGWRAGTGAASSCAGSGSCTITLTADSSLDATYLLENTLALREAGTGTGTVTSEPAGLDCGLTCEAIFAHNQTVTLSAAANEGKVGGWSGCESVSGPGEEKCTVRVSVAKLVTVQFDAEPLLTVAREGTGAAEGRVTSTPAGIDCGSECTDPVPIGNTIVLEEHAEAGSFGGWTGCTSEPEGRCEVLMSAAKEVRAKFTAPAPAEFKLQAQVSGGGEIVSQPGTIACKEGSAAGQCEEEVNSSSTVKLKAQAESGWALEEWTEGPCAGSNATSCEFTMPSHDVSVGAKFAVSHQHKLTVVKFGEGGVKTATPPGLTCGPTQLECVAEFDEGAHILLEESPATGYQFAGWIGCKVKSSTTCEVEASTDLDVAAIFLKEGSAGKEGPAGGVGPQGPAGPGGSPGQPGAAGASGEPGAAGASGERGAASAPGASGPAGPAGPQGPAGKPGTVELVTCQTVKQKGVKVRKCATKQVPGPVTLKATGSSARATLSRQGAVYAVGVARGEHYGRLRMRLEPHRRLRPGRYTLTLIAGSGGHERIRNERFIVTGPALDLSTS